MKKLLTVSLILTLSLISTVAYAIGAPSPMAYNILDYTIIINKEHPLPDNWWKVARLVEVEDFRGGTLHQVERETYEKFLELRESLLAEGVQIELESCYRSVEAQQKIWDESVAEFGEEYTKNHVAEPGYSEHQSGIAIDIAIVKDGVAIEEKDAMLAESDIFEIIHYKLADYGFILRYPEGKADITGYDYKPWHLRYVGFTEFAHILMDNALTMEEYYNKPFF